MHVDFMNEFSTTCSAMTCPRTLRISTQNPTDKMAGPRGESRNEDTCPLPSSRVRLPVDMVRLVLRELDVQWKSGNLDEGDRMVLHELAMDIDALANRPCPSGDPDIAGAKAHVSYSPIPPPVAPNVPSAPLAGDPQMPPDIMRPTDVTNGIVKKKPGNSPSGNMALVPSGENTAAGGSACTDPEAPTVEQLRQALLDIFQELDGDSSGTIGAPELRRALNALQFPRARTTKLLNAADQSGFVLIQGVSCTDKFLLICFQPYKDRCVA